MSNWKPIETAPTDYTEIIGMDARGHVYRTWWFAPSSMTRDWLRVPGNKEWKPLWWMPLPPPPRSPDAAEGGEVVG
ncbi:hypothetical protein SAMN02745194_04516 [Roseomonas rosea]|uniref:DUF551 domain-containing protein n=1 Tax=Muricoccus roseus TaxID=198092 RepID=A0A1M6QTZ8_9PROT|nr:hypothetical protein [Roseomonas rosea]SHK23731.1 hypothetical protein SAMN02745194_04516 [Roseomonas rosea]